MMRSSLLVGLLALGLMPAHAVELTPTTDTGSAIVLSQPSSPSSPINPDDLSSVISVRLEAAEQSAAAREEPPASAQSAPAPVVALAPAAEAKPQEAPETPVAKIEAAPTAETQPAGAPTVALAPAPITEAKPEPAAAPAPAPASEPEAQQAAQPSLAQAPVAAKDEQTAEPSATQPASQDVAAVLDALLKERASWGTHPALTSEALNSEPVSTVAAVAEPVQQIAAALPALVTPAAADVPKTAPAPERTDATLVGNAPDSTTDIRAAVGVDTPASAPAAEPAMVVAEAPVIKQPSAEQVDQALKALLAERETWGKQPSLRVPAPEKAATKAAEPAPVAKATATAAPSDVDAALKALLAARAELGAAPAKASADLNNPAPKTAAAPAAPVQVAVNTASPKQIDETLKTLLAERAKWGTQPSKSSADLNNPAAAAQKVAAAPVSTPAPALTQIAPKQIDDALKTLLAERAKWGTQPSKSSADLNNAGGAAKKAAAPAPSATAATAAPGPVSQQQVDAALKVLLDERAKLGTAPSTKTAAVDTKAVTPPPAVSAANKACQANLRAIAGAMEVNFASGSFRLDPLSVTALANLASVAKSCSGAKIKIEGHTDSVGVPAINKALSEQRARAVLGHLKSVGVSAAAMTAVGVGSAQPIAPNDTEANRWRNRRIVISVE